MKVRVEMILIPEWDDEDEIVLKEIEAAFRAEVEFWVDTLESITVQALED